MCGFIQEQTVFSPSQRCGMGTKALPVVFLSMSAGCPCPAGDVRDGRGLRCGLCLPHWNAYMRWWQV